MKLSAQSRYFLSKIVNQFSAWNIIRRRGSHFQGTINVVLQDPLVFCTQFGQLNNFGQLHGLLRLKNSNLHDFSITVKHRS